MSIVVKYFSNNSGGYDWLSQADWQALRDAGWVVAGFYDDPDAKEPTYAYKRCETMADGIAEWRAIVGQDPYEEGCPCCGRPHQFSEGDEEDLHPAPPKQCACGTSVAPDKDECDDCRHDRHQRSVRETTLTTLRMLLRDLNADEARRIFDEISDTSTPFARVINAYADWCGGQWVPRDKQPANWADVKVGKG